MIFFYLNGKGKWHTEIYNVPGTTSDTSLLHHVTSCAKKIPFSIFVYLSKAFDTLNHKVLLTKLHYYEIRDIALIWLRSYLTKRTQYVDCNGVSSSIREIETGMPQGSILGPILFIIYMNDIHTVSDNLNFILYADDTTLSSPMCSFTRGCNGNIELISTLFNSELNKIADWLAVNKLSLNVQKTKFMIFHYRQRVLTDKDLPCLKINSTLIERVTEFNSLTANEYMNWNSHVQKIANKMASLIEFVPLLCICILEPVRKLTH